MVLYHKDPEVRYRLYPAGGGEEFSELEKVPEIHPTDELVLLRNLSVTPLEFKRWLDSSFFKHSITRAFFLNNQMATSKEDLMLQLAAMEAPQAAVRVMAYPKSMERYIVENLPLGWDLHPVNYTQTLFVVHVSPTCLRFTLRPAEETYLTSPDGPTRVEGQLCRAEGKLTEALMVTGFEPGAGAAIDVGAAPGGWTAQLARSMHLVAAVDPAELDTQVAALPNVVHIKAKSEDATDQIKAAVGEHGVDLVVCDANKHPEQLLMMLEPLLELLPSGGLVIFTLKFRGRGKDKKLGAGKLLGDLEKLGYRDIKLLWLLANTVHERTVVAVKR